MDWQAGRFTIPNGLSLARLGLGLCYPWLAPSWRLPVLVIAALTDLLDGAAGRLMGATSNAGRILDPLADKVFLAAVVMTLLLDQAVTVWEVVLVGARDLTVFAGVVTGLALRKWGAFRRMAPTLLGKTTTAAQFVFLVVVLTAPEGKRVAFPVTACLSALAAGHYLWLFLTLAFEERRDVSRP